ARLAVAADGERLAQLAALAAGLASLTLLGLALALELLLLPPPLALFLATLFFLALGSSSGGLGFLFLGRLRRRRFGLGLRLRLRRRLGSGRLLGLLRLFFSLALGLFLGGTRFLFGATGLFLGALASFFLRAQPRLFLGPLDVVLQHLFQHLGVAPLFLGLDHAAVHIGAPPAHLDRHRPGLPRAAGPGAGGRQLDLAVALARQGDLGRCAGIVGRLALHGAQVVQQGGLVIVRNRGVGAARLEARFAQLRQQAFHRNPDLVRQLSYCYFRHIVPPPSSAAAPAAARVPVSGVYAAR